MKHRSLLAVAVAATLSPAAEAGTTNLALTTVESYSTSGVSLGNIGSSTATFSYDDVADLLTQTGGTFNVRFTIAPTNTLFRHLMTGVVLGNGAAATASTFVCAEGNFGGAIGASLCGNYNFGANYVDESVATWGPGTSFDRTLGGDDVAIGPMHSVSWYDGFNTGSWTGSQLVIANSFCSGGGTGCTNPTSGYQWTLQAIPLEPDTDGDGVPDQIDNCTLLTNPNQCDSDGDGFGNRCDGDLNNNLATSAQDYILFRAQIGQPSVAPAYNAADISCNGAVNSSDFILFRGLLGSPPGPSGSSP